MAYTARYFTSVEAEKIGLVSKVVEGGRDEVVKEALALAKVISKKSVIAVMGSKHLITHARDHRYVFFFRWLCILDADRMGNSAYRKTWLILVHGTVPC